MKMPTAVKERTGLGTKRSAGVAVAELMALAVMSLMDGAKWIAVKTRLVFERLRIAQGWRGNERQMKVVESLTLGGKRQLFLVTCKEQRYLVGTGGDGVGTIVAMAAETAANEPEKEAGKRFDARPGLRARDIRGPELVRHKGTVSSSRRSHETDDAQAGLELWH